MHNKGDTANERLSECEWRQRETVNTETQQHKRQHPKQRVRVCGWVSGKGGVEVWRVGGRCRTKSKGLGNATPTGVDTAERECKEWVAKPQCSQRAGLHHTYRHTKGGV